ncbi:glucans biosynthesis protein [Gemmata obscuriglobus]|uniref:Acyltransferase 3 domain-containing protein n=2 Tax=Gemmata obscuriglobus TaxID=114 RepID=A0A2Z3H8M0_9BACT|nr:acyltransferase family protein [Gemmata obscuriglobus]AWM41231.1 hypothetical protein C1280_32390 [Gemmata obscuriglobus]QEG25426.1 glucans biosynthesis protein [Gemmata obscuriglobus]VTR98543.1 acyltransferase 3 : Acyltransferase 3 OS=Fibrisoma limi BUZ 3 GN=BN8_01119 PE=4 SV=1: Acyl_transf_3 [Gemmata obscuriglobus UQM 2246]
MMAEPNTSSSRVAALDNLRVVAMFLGLVTHGVLPYTATGLIGFPVRDHTRHAAADVCFFAVHDFRMQLFFLLAGFGACALASRRGASELVRNRLARVALPLALAVLILCPALHLIFAAHTATRGATWAADGAGGWVGPNFHLWFLYYLLMCCAVWVAIRSIGLRLPFGIVCAFDALARRALASRWKVPAVAAIAVPVLWDMPAWWIDTPKGWGPDITVLAYYLGFFFVGALLHRHRDMLATVGRRWAVRLAVANVVVLPLMLKLTVTGNWAEEERDTDPARLAVWKAVAIFVGGLYTWLMIGGLIGLFQRYFAAGGPRWAYLADASYWCYLIGFPVQAAFQVWFAPTTLPVVAEFLLVCVFTLAVSLASYELGVRHTRLGVLLNGKRPKRDRGRVPEPVRDTRPRPVPAVHVG